MLLRKIITLANKRDEVAFRVMERSLRATGCRLPIEVIPYDDDLFELPPGSSWWRVPPLLELLDGAHAHPMMRKYQCLLISGYQYVDTDVIFMRNPEHALSEHTGFVVCCGHWRDPSHTTTDALISVLSAQTTNWQSRVFNAGQFACDTTLYTIDTLRAAVSAPENRSTCLTFPHHDQPGLNMLVALSGIHVKNLTLPPASLESSWAGDYPSEYESTWGNGNQPYLMHWAGLPITGERPIDELYLRFMSESEREKWRKRRAKGPEGRPSATARLQNRVRAVWRRIAERIS